MNCPHCNAPLSPNFSFCMNCGAPVDTDATVILSNNAPENMQQNIPSQQTVPPSAFIPDPPKKKGGKKTGLIIAIVLIVMLLGAGAALLVLDYTDTIDFIDFLPFEESDKDDGKDDDKDKDRDKENNKNQPQVATSDADYEATTAAVDIPAEMIASPDTYFSSTAEKYYIVDPTTSLINLYSSCTTDSSIEGRIDEDTVVKAIGEFNGWLCIEYNNSSSGYAWVQKKYLSLTSEPEGYDPNIPDADTIKKLESQEDKNLKVVFPHPDSIYYVGDKSDLAGTSVYELKDGEIVLVYGFERNYAYIKVGSYYGWCDASCFKESSEIGSVENVDEIINYFASQSDAYYRVFDTGYSGLNLRTENNTDSEVIKVLQESEIVLVYGIEDGWAFVKTDDSRTEKGLCGWCSSEFLQYYSAY